MPAKPSRRAPAPPPAAEPPPEPAARPGATDSRPLLFLHIPKTAGTSFFTTLHNLFGEAQVAPLEMAGNHLYERLRAIADDPDTRIACAYGHIPIDQFHGFPDLFRPFTILRHPVERVLSLIRFERANPDIAELGLRPDFTFDEFLAARAAPIESQVNNGMCRMLAGDGTFTNPALPGYHDSRNHPELIGRALEFLERIDFGLAEDMAGTHRIIQHRWGIPFTLDEMVLNTTKRNEHFDWRRIHAIVERNTFDIVLYERAAALFRERLARLPDTLAAPPASRMLFRPALGSWASLDAVPGRQGFHPWEDNGIAWLNEGPPARIHFLAPAPSARICLRVLGIGQNYPVDQIQLQLDGRPLPFRTTDPDGPWCTLETRLAGLASGINTLAIAAPRFIPVRDLQPTSPDRRRLGLAVAGIVLLD